MGHKNGNWVSVMTPTYVVVGIAERAEFDRIELPVTNHGGHVGRAVLTKTARDAGGLTVVFQHWYGPTPAERLEAAAVAQRLARQGTAGVAA
jgi:hypothetical protein